MSLEMIPTKEYIAAKWLQNAYSFVSVLPTKTVEDYIYAIR